MSNPGKFVVFTLGKERFGLPIASVERILAAPPLTRIPRTPRELRGVFDLRGDVLPVLDTRALLGLPEGEPGCLLVIDTNGRRMAVTADRVELIAEYEDNDIQDVRASAEREVRVSRQGDTITLLLDPDDMVPETLAKRAVKAAERAA
jgi:purine-binding chemotaxis protein CheW